MNLLIVARAISGFVDPPVGLKWYSSSSSQKKRTIVCSQLESAPSGKGSGGRRFRLPLPKGVALPFPFTSTPDRCGP